jgi:hypothetical protein
MYMHDIFYQHSSTGRSPMIHMGPLIVVMIVMFVSRRFRVCP